MSRHEQALDSLVKMLETAFVLHPWEIHDPRN